MSDGGYDAGYEACPCFWGRRPGSLVEELVRRMSVRGSKVLDAGAGEGKNAAFLVDRGTRVVAVEASGVAIANGQREFGPLESLTWMHHDIESFDLGPSEYDGVIAYGLFHCLPDGLAIQELVGRLKRATKPGGWHVVCAFNDRSQDLSAHDGFSPCLLSHAAYMALYADWHLDVVSDSDLTESHPHNGLLHTHSMTRLLARKPA